MIRARELYDLGMIVESRREWDYAIAALNPRQRQLAAVLAHRWGWYDRAIIASAKANYFDDLEVRFPVLFRDQVLKNSESHDLDPAWIYGVMRQESAFTVDARSSAGALGLMQLMPATGKHTAQLLNTPLRATNELLDADKNIQLGSAYLHQVLDENNGDVVRATASYNAGPQRVKQWLPAASMPADIWVENVPFTETRNYIQQVMAYTTIFYQRLSREIIPLKKRMQDIGPE
jgi:soluble lytic murein transglycosylase